MSEHAVPHEPLSVEEYLKLEATSQRRHEYVGGVIHPHAGGTSRHNVIATNILASLERGMRRPLPRLRQRHVATRVRRGLLLPGRDGGLRRRAGDEALYQVAPCLVVEVTSPTTEATDRREKMLAYRRIPSLKACLIVAQEGPRVERHWHDEAGRWWQAEAVGPEGIVPVPCPEVELTLAQIYEGLQEPA